MAKKSKRRLFKNKTGKSERSYFGRKSIKKKIPEYIDKEPKYYVGTFISNKKGFGFVSVEGYSEDFFIPEKFTLNAFLGDEVRLCELPKRGKRFEAKVVKIISHTITQVVGTYIRSGSFGFVCPDNGKIGRDIYVPASADMGAENGAKVLVNITDYGSENKGPAGIITEIIGNVGDPFVDIISIAMSYGIMPDFPKEVTDEAESIPLEISKSDKRGRLNLTKEMVITIDGDDSKDFDDAISVKKDGDYYELGVHIADVTNYVKENSALDKEAYKRSTSVYLTDVVMPMLPERLCNGICSLVEGEERLTLSCVMKIDEKGNVVESMVTPSFIVSKKRFTYNIVNKILKEPKGSVAKEYAEFVPMLKEARTLAKLLRKNREKRGAIDFDIPESKIVLDEKGHAIDVKARERGESERMIEDFMLAANETVAKTYYDKEIPFLYRSHEEPTLEKIYNLADLCALFGIKFRVNKNGKVKPKNIQSLIKEAKKSEYEGMFSSVTLRSMQQAKYSDINPSHFGIAAPYYCHFTSPIRRYPDLLIHRIIKECKKNGLTAKRVEFYKGFLPLAADVTSKLERRAVECEREVEKLKKCEYMQKFVGCEYDGVVTGVSHFGIFVGLPNTIEGLVPIGSMGRDHFVCNEKLYRVVGEQTGKTYMLGDKIKVAVDRVDNVLRTIDFRIIENGKEESKSKGILKKKHSKK